MLVEKIVAELTTRFKERKDISLRESILEINPNYDFSKLEGYRFKDVACEIDHKSVERYYFNDGSKDGVLLMSCRIETTLNPFNCVLIIE